MCEKCDQIDIKLEQFRRLDTPDMDPFALGTMRSAIDDLLAEKDALNCEQGSNEVRIAKLKRLIEQINDPVTTKRLAVYVAGLEQHLKNQK